jgi:hypothetical protein
MYEVHLRVQGFRDFDAFVDIVAVLETLDGAHAKFYGRYVSDPAADGVDHGQRETHTIFEASAPPIRALIVARR